MKKRITRKRIEKASRRRNKPNQRKLMPVNPSKSDARPVSDTPYMRTHSHRIEDVGKYYGSFYIMPAHGWKPPGWDSKMRVKHVHPDLRRTYKQNNRASGHCVTGPGDCARTDRFSYAPDINHKTRNQ